MEKPTTADGYSSGLAVEARRVCLHVATVLGDPGKLQSLEPDFAAIVTPALPVAFTDFIVVTIDDETPAGELAKRLVRVCGPAAFIVLKAHALRLRGANKDAYDLMYVLMNFGDGGRRSGREVCGHRAGDGSQASSGVPP